MVIGVPGIPKEHIDGRTMVVQAPPALRWGRHIHVLSMFH
jgi:hypothetical protein